MIKSQHHSDIHRAGHVRLRTHPQQDHGVINRGTMPNSAKQTCDTNLTSFYVPSVEVLFLSRSPLRVTWPLGRTSKESRQHDCTGQEHGLKVGWWFYRWGKMFVWGVFFFVTLQQWCKEQSNSQPIRSLHLHRFRTIRHMIYCGRGFGFVRNNQLSTIMAEKSKYLANAGNVYMTRFSY